MVLCFLLACLYLFQVYFIEKCSFCTRIVNSYIIYFVAKRNVPIVLYRLQQDNYLSNI